METDYVVISPVRDEETYIRRTLDSVINQTILPKRWILLDDGSTDGTKEILESYAQIHKWIQVLEYTRDSSDRMVGKNVVEILHCGLSEVQDIHWDFWVKLDGDISFGSNYFEELLCRFHENSKLGMASGKAYNPKANGGYKLEWNHDQNVLGMARMYRRECWEDIGALARRRLWDVIDVYTAQMHGWQTESFPDLSIVHSRPIDTRQKGQLARRFDAGQNHYTMGYHPLYFLFRCLRATLDEKPFLLSGVMMCIGFFYAWISRQAIYDSQLKSYIHQTQRRFLTPRSFFIYLKRRNTSYVRDK